MHNQGQVHPIRGTQSYMQAGGGSPQTQVHLPVGHPTRVSLPLPEVWGRVALALSPSTVPIKVP